MACSSHRAVASTAACRPWAPWILTTWTTWITWTPWIAWTPWISPRSPWTTTPPPVEEAVEAAAWPTWTCPEWEAALATAPKLCTLCGETYNVSITLPYIPKISPVFSYIEKLTMSVSPHLTFLATWIFIYWETHHISITILIWKLFPPPVSPYITFLTTCTFIYLDAYDISITIPEIALHLNFHIFGNLSYY